MFKKAIVIFFKFFISREIFDCNYEFISDNSEFVMQTWVYISQFWKKKSKMWDVNSELREKGTITFLFFYRVMETGLYRLMYVPWA